MGFVVQYWRSIHPHKRRGTSPNVSISMPLGGTERTLTYRWRQVMGIWFIWATEVTTGRLNRSRPLQVMRSRSNCSGTEEAPTYLGQISSSKVEKDTHSPSPGASFTFPCENILQKLILQKHSKIYTPNNFDLTKISPYQKADLCLNPKFSQTRFTHFRTRFTILTSVLYIWWQMLTGLLEFV